MLPADIVYIMDLVDDRLKPLLKDIAALKTAERRKTVRAKAPCNNASVQLPRSCKVCILNKMCDSEYAMEQCWRNAVTAHFA